MNEVTIKIPCPDCPLTFRSSGYMQAHRRKSHAPAPMRHQRITPPPVAQPVRTTSVAHVEYLPETPRLMNGAHLEAGEVFYQVRTFVIRKITKTAGSRDVSVEAECLNRKWQSDKPL